MSSLARNGTNASAPHRLRTVLALCAILLMMVAVSSISNAATRMYTGEMIFDAFGNDTTDGTGSRFTQYVQGFIPFGSAACNLLPFHPEETLVFSSMMAGMTYTWQLNVPDYGGQIPTYSYNGMTYAPGCVDTGVPLVGGGSAVTTDGATPLAPRPISLQASDLVRLTSGGSFTASAVYVFGFEYADLKNGPGVFFEGGGGGNFTVQHMQGGNVEGKVAGIAGDNQFGGVMRLLGEYSDLEGYYKINHIVVANYNWLFEKIGASGIVSMEGGVITQGSLAYTVNIGTATNDGAMSTTSVKASAFPWTTGTVSVTAVRGPLVSVQQRAGYDNRTALGAGTIQMVSPLLTSWIYTGGSYETSSIGILNLKFVPEAGSMLMLGAGASLLGLLYTANRKR